VSPGAKLISPQSVTCLPVLAQATKKEAAPASAQRALDHRFIIARLRRPQRERDRKCDPAESLVAAR
jgi:hypothetical protein